MDNKNTFTLTSTFIALLLISSCSTTSSQPSFQHAKHGKLSVSSAIVDKELRSCSAQIKQQPQQNVTLGAPSIVSASIPIIETTEITKGIVKGSNVVKAIVIAKTIRKAHTNIFSCMQEKGWKSTY